jgi:copper chaperone
MKVRNFPLFILVFASLILMSCGQRKAAPAGEKMVSYTLAVEGMTCAGCEQTIQTKVAKIEGVEVVSDSHTAGEVQVSFYPSQADTVSIKEAIAGAGYKVGLLALIKSDTIQ